ncbi:MAG: cytochrome-c peroxidase [Paracoccaceae bacterium]
MRLLCAALLVSGSAAAQDLGPPPVYESVDPKAAVLGQLLFYDPILSGNKNISCATCHHPKFGTSDGVSLALGEGGKGLGPDRQPDPNNTPEQRIPRNAPALWNLGAIEFSVMFHDGRLEADPNEPGGIRTPLGEDMTSGFDSVLSAQAMFPVLSGDEMAGHYSENEISEAVRLGHLSIPGGAWDRISSRLETIPEYRAAFDQVIGAGEPIRFTDIANAMGAFIRAEWRSDTSPFDLYQRDGVPLPADAERGRALFYGDAGCVSCHAGWFQTDHGFHAIALPQIGPGKAARFEIHARDEGRGRVTGEPADAYRFRTPSLRNVALTGPYGHNGAYATLEGVVRHHLDPVAALKAYDPAQAILPRLDGAEDLRVVENAADTRQIARANELTSIALSDAEVADVLAFLNALTDAEAVKGRLGIPDTVPSGLPVER